VDQEGQFAEENFPTVLKSMLTLLLHGTLLDSVGEYMEAIQEAGGTLLGVAFLVFIFMSSFTVLNLLIGVLCEVINDVTKQEKERSETAFLKDNLFEILKCYDKDEDNHFSKQEFLLLMQNPDFRLVLDRFGTDVGGLQALSNVLYHGKKRLSFKAFIDVILRLRGGNVATVLDVVELRDYVNVRHNELLDQFAAVVCLLSPKTPAAMDLRKSDAPQFLGRQTS